MFPPQFKTVDKNSEVFFFWSVTWLERGKRKETKMGEGLGFYKVYIAGMMASLATLSIPSRYPHLNPNLYHVGIFVFQVCIDRYVTFCT